MSKHTPEPWKKLYNGGQPAIGNDEIYITTINTHSHGESVENAANAERIVACVNGCAGLNPTAYQPVLNLLKDAQQLWGVKNTVLHNQIERAIAAAENIA